MPRKNNNLRIGFGLSILILLISTAFSFFCIRGFVESARMVDHTNEVKSTVEKIISALKDAETGQRGYLLTGEKDYLQPFEGSYSAAMKNIEKAESLTIDNPVQQKILADLKASMNSRMDQLMIMIGKKKQNQPISYDDLRKGKIYMDSARAQTERMKAEENRLLVTRTAKQRTFGMLTPIVILIAAMLAVIISVVFYRRAVKDLLQRTRMQQVLEEKDRETAERITAIQKVAARISEGDYALRMDDDEKDSLGELSVSMNRMAESLSESFTLLGDNEWLQRGVASLNDRMLGEKDLNLLVKQVIEFVTGFLDAHVGAFYLLEKQTLVLLSGYALMDSAQKEIGMGEGIVGQAMLSRKPIIIEDVDPEYVTVTHATGNIRPRTVIAHPVVFEGAPVGVLELASLHLLTEREKLYLQTISSNIGNALQAAINHKKLQELLEETQSQSEELQAQHSELENMNAELEAHTQKLQTSEEELRVQQEELQQSNFELEERNRIINERNLEILTKAEELEQSTRYKSEFMANMSHELRTPLNSILLLSRYLFENSEHNLSDDQMESAKVIFNSGSGLLDLIDELLDLSKIEAGKMDLEYIQVPVKEIATGIQSLFLPVAREKSIGFRVVSPAEESLVIETDRMKLEQILKNLISNAIKFTAEGSVTLTIEEAPGQPDMLSFSVTDTGVGIPKEKLGLVFEAFTQADGSTKRKYGGTGLGLSISRQLARLLGGEISVKSRPGSGSTFTLLIPRQAVNAGAAPAAPEVKLLNRAYGEGHDAEDAPLPKQKLTVDVIPAEIEDDRFNVTESDKVILIVEDDTAFAKALLQFSHQHGYKCIIAVRGDEGVRLARQYTPQAILLDIQLPVMDGWEVMEELKSHKTTRHIPVHTMSSLEAKRESRIHGAVDFINKPIAFEQMRQMFQKLESALNKSPKKVLIIEENPKHAKALSYFLETYSVTASIRHTVPESINTLQQQDVDCVILDMGLPNQTSYEALENVKNTPGLEDLPIIIFTGKNLSHAEESRIRQYADSIIMKTAHSYQRILDEVALFLHLVEQNKNTRNTSDRRDHLNDILHGKTILVADDDVRNIFSLTKSLEKHQVKVITATDGTEALDQLEAHPETDIILMDMMMPQMDGYETTTKIRNHPKYKNIPVIAVTAKAMLGDREKCIAAGAADYISKPVDLDQLISLLRVWLYDKQG